MFLVVLVQIKVSLFKIYAVKKVVIQVALIELHFEGYYFSFTRTEPKFGFWTVATFDNQGAGKHPGEPNPPPCKPPLTYVINNSNIKIIQFHKNFIPL